jgi:site-specific recombinase XerD
MISLFLNPHHDRLWGGECLTIEFKHFTSLSNIETTPITPAVMRHHFASFPEGKLRIAFASSALYF